MKKWIPIFLCLLCVAAIACYLFLPHGPENSYQGPYPMLHEALQRSVPGIRDEASDQVMLLETDGFGRTLYAFLGDSDMAPYLSRNPLREMDSYRLVVLAVAQTYDGSSVSFYEDRNYIFRYIKDDSISGHPAEAAQTFANQVFGREGIAGLKEDNDWGRPLSPASCWYLTSKTEPPFTGPRLTSIFSPLAGNFRTSFLNMDSKGNSIYFLENRDSEKLYLVFVTPYGAIPESGIVQLWDVRDYGAALAQLKSENGWVPQSTRVLQFPAAPVAVLWNL